jgi:Na+/phosphate symporter
MVKVSNNISNIGSTQFNVAKANEDAFNKYSFKSSISIYLFAFNTAFPLYVQLSIVIAGIILPFLDLIVLDPNIGFAIFLSTPAGACFSP